MADETKKTEENKTSSPNANNPQQQQNGLQDALNAIWNFLNQPVIANAGLGAALYWALDPKGLKTTLEEISEQMELMSKTLVEQNRQIAEMKKQMEKISREFSDEENDNQQHNQLNGYRKAKQRNEPDVFYLD